MYGLPCTSELVVSRMICSSNVVGSPGRGDHVDGKREQRHREEQAPHASRNLPRRPVPERPSPSTGSYRALHEANGALRIAVFTRPRGMWHDDAMPPRLPPGRS